MMAKGVVRGPGLCQGAVAMSMTVVITSGPSYEPLDAVRRFTNFSTGRLGTNLARTMVARGARVILFRGEQATCRESVVGGELREFTTNEDLSVQLERLGREDTSVSAVLHAAALCDFKPGSVVDGGGCRLETSKLPTRSGVLRMELVPAVKVLPRLRGWFPASRVVGWKYELAGGRAEALAAVQRQFVEASTDACVVNGSAYGSGFGLVFPDGRLVECRDGLVLGQVLADWLLP